MKHLCNTLPNNCIKNARKQRELGPLYRSACRTLYIKDKQRGGGMKTPICPTCGCSLVRLGITKENAVARKYHEVEYSFCCDGCAELFDKTPEDFLEETKNLVVCPSCLAEKSVDQTVSCDYKGESIHFCKCPYCMTVFKKDPEYFIKRLSGEVKYTGVFAEGKGCCS